MFLFSVLPLALFYLHLLLPASLQNPQPQPASSSSPAVAHRTTVVHLLQGSGPLGKVLPEAGGWAASGRIYDW